ncbi:tetratricopeptide repeat protein [Aliarcobacter butzleri]|uniref:hypothetical protein n=1 Tax=Aliarcobacter butzleri TaxID=28197 RepID=UPI0021B1A7BB|nr:hypothetical protein [Aliarcobacter butzleri]MCT7619161.1 hypothetical protein [Aliarcobacter butzleri]
MDKQKKEFKFEIDLQSNTIVGSTETSLDNLDVRISDSIKQAFASMASNSWSDEFCENINNQDIDKAYQLFEKNKFFLMNVSDKTILKKLRLLNIELLDKKQKKEFLTYLIVIAQKMNQRDDLSEKEIDILLNEYKDELEIELILNFKLAKANISASKKLYHQAVSRYKKLLEEKDMQASTKAWVYQGLSLIANNDDDYILYTNLAMDTFLESGYKKEAISNIVKLADFESKTDVNKALERLDYAIKIIGDMSLLDKEYAASLKQRKAQLLYSKNSLNKALEESEEACSLRRGLLGNEVALHSSLSLASIIAQRLNKTEKQQSYDDEARKVAKLIKDENFSLRQKLLSYVQQKNKIPQDLINKAIEANDNHTLCAIYMHQYSIIDDNDEAIELIDKAILLAEELKNETLLSDLYMAIAEKNRQYNYSQEAFVAYKKSLNYNPLNFTSYQNCTHMLFKNELYEDAELFLKNQIEIIGELPNICFYYARVLYENKKYNLALQYFKKSNQSIEGIDTYILECAKNMDSNTITDIPIPVQPKIISIEKFLNALQEFAQSVSQDSRMHFWKYDKDKAKYKWTEKPEEESKQLLINFLNGKFGKNSIEIIQEPRAGAGFIDLYILLEGGHKVVIELKMCGTGYSSTYAISGESQIIHYAKNKNTHIGFLVVFDSRVRDYGKSFKDIQTVDNILIHTVAIDVRSEIKKD